MEINYALVVVDYFSKWPDVISLPNQRATRIAAALLREVVSRHGVPLELHSDQDRSFKSAVFKELMQLLGIKNTRITSLHPQSDGLLEMMMKDFVAIFVPLRTIRKIGTSGFRFSFWHTDRLGTRLLNVRRPWYLWDTNS